MFKKYFKDLYQRTMKEAYALANDEIEIALKNGGRCLDCGAYDGYKFRYLQKSINLTSNRYTGLEWNKNLVAKAREENINLIEADLNRGLTFPENHFQCVICLSVLEHLLNPCRYLQDSYRCLEPGGSIIILTPNISTYFTIALLLLGKMPSSGPHPDSEILMKHEQVMKVSHDNLQTDTEDANPVHRHLVVFSYRVLKSYLAMIGFRELRGYGFGLYPFPKLLQPVLEKIDPYHCHQMVFIATK